MIQLPVRNIKLLLRNTIENHKKKLNQDKSEVFRKYSILNEYTNPIVTLPFMEFSVHKSDLETYTSKK